MSLGNRCEICWVSCASLLWHSLGFLHLSFFDAYANRLGLSEHAQIIAVLDLKAPYQETSNLFLQISENVITLRIQRLITV